MGLFLRKNHLLRCWVWLFLLNWIGALTLSLLLKLFPRELEPWFIPWSFFLLMLLCFSINLSYAYAWYTVAHCCNWAGASSCYFELLDKLQKGIRRTAGPSLTTSLEPLAHRQHVASTSLLYRYYFGICSSELAQLVLLPYSWGRSTRYSNRLHDFSVTIPRCYKDVYVNSFFPRTARLWNSLSIECFPLTYDLIAFKSRIIRHLLTLRFYKQISCIL